MTAPVSIEGVNHWFDSYHALRDITLNISAGEYIALLGPSGCGKTTLLSVLGGFVEPDQGTVMIDDLDVTHLPAARRPTTTVFQDYALFPHMNLRDNVAFGLRMAGQARKARHAVANEKLDLVGLGAEGSKRPHALSGGQRQRVALARGLAVDPDVMLLDEPLGALDLKLRRAMQDELKGIQRKVGTTFVHVTHDQEEAMAIADRIVVMNAGRIEDVGTPERVYTTPATLFTAGFMGELTRFPARRGADGGIETPFGPLSRAAVARDMALCIRPEAVKIGQSGVSLGPGRIVDVAFFGTHLRAFVTLKAAPDTTLIAYLPLTAQVSAGQVVGLCVDPEHVLLFPEESPNA